MTRRRIFFAIAALLVIVVCFVVYETAFWGSVSATGGDKLIINGSVYSQRSVKLRPGHYKIVAANPLKQPFTENITIYPFKRVSIINNNPTFGTDEVLKLSGFTVPKDYRMVNPKFLSNNQWLVVRFYSQKPTSEGFVGIFNYTYGKSWQVYNTGVGFGEELNSINSEVYNYVNAN